MKLSKFKNWFLPVIGLVLTIADLGFEAINPLLLAIGVPDKWIGILKAVLGIYGIYKISTNKPIIKKYSFSDDNGDIGGGGIKNPPTNN